MLTGQRGRRAEHAVAAITALSGRAAAALRNERPSPALTAYVRGHSGSAHIGSQLGDDLLVTDNSGIADTLVAHYANVSVGGPRDATTTLKGLDALLADVDAAAPSPH
eukprot:366498-Chlamydomonas_euryale.AAC.4